MKKKLKSVILAVILILTATIFVIRSQIGKPNGDPPSAYFFTAKIVETEVEVFHNEMFIVEATGYGYGNDSTTTLGARISIPSSTMSKFDCDELAPGGYIRVIFDGVAEHSDPMQLGEIYDIRSSDESGDSIYGS